MHLLAQEADCSFTQLQVAMLCVAAMLSECAPGTTPLMIVSLHQDSGVSRHSGVSRKWMEGAQKVDFNASVCDSLGLCHGDFRLLSAAGD